MEMADPKTILIIDDEISILESLGDFFEHHGYTVFSAADGDQGLDIFSTRQIDIVLTDLRMPKLDGIEVMKTIHDRRPDMPMIVVSGAGEEDDIIHALRMGAKDYIKKPILDLNMILHTVEKVLEHQRLNEENKQFRDQIIQSENQHRIITENIAEGVFTVDEQENFTYTNQAFCKMIGYPCDQVLKKNLADVSTTDSFDVIQLQTQQRRAGLTSRYEIQLLNRNKETVHVELCCSPIASDGSDYQGAIAVVRDITKIIELREKYHKFLEQQESTSKSVIPICASCKNIRVKDENWISIEDYFKDIVFSHGICSHCCDKLYPELDLSEDTD